MFTVYILYSDTTERYYVGQTNDMVARLQRHNSGQSVYTKHGQPWTLVYTAEFLNRSEAMLSEKKIKKRGASRFLNDMRTKG
ncbi:MAG: GIY-YIG nuclease family protein [Chitinophagaceae bacterium]|nr:MAG: GIY-YIG nuclease family protein [Chitinophagaceae bacterium]